MEILQMNKGMSSRFEIRGFTPEKSYELGMIRHNSFRYIPEAVNMIIDGENVLSYRIDGLGSLDKRFSLRAPSISDVKKLLSDLGACIEEIKDYLLPASGIALDEKHILYDPESREYRFIYVPGGIGDFSAMLKRLFENIMLIFDHGNRDGVVELYDMYSKVLGDNFTPDMLHSMLEDKGTGSADEPFGPFQPEEPRNGELRDEDKGYGDISVKETPLTEMEHYEDAVKSSEDRFNDKVRYLIIGGVVSIIAGAALFLIFGSGAVKAIILIAVIFIAWMIYMIARADDTEEPKSVSRELVDREPLDRKRVGREPVNPESVDPVLTSCAGNDKQPVTHNVTKLIPVGGNKSSGLLIPDGTTRVGRTLSKCDYCLSGSGISRLHAELKRTPDGIYLTDKDSTNGTYVNGTRLVPGMPRLLKKGDQVSFAGTEFCCI